jgi:hypothetical protein
MPAFVTYLRDPSAALAGGTCSAEVARIVESTLFEISDEIVLAANWQVDTAENGLALARAIVASGREVSILGVAAFNDMASLSMQLSRIDQPVDRFFFRNIRSRFLSVNAIFSEASRGADNIRYLDKLSIYCNSVSASCDMLDSDGKPIIFDSAHVTAPGVTVMAERIREAEWFE